MPPPIDALRRATLDGLTHVVDTTTGEVLGRLVRERRSVLESGPEGRCPKRRKLPATPGCGGAVPRAAKDGGTRPGIHRRRRDLRDALWARLQNVGRDLVQAGHLVPDGGGGYSLRDVVPNELVPDHNARLRQVYRWLSEAWKGVGRCCTHPIKAHVEVQEKRNGGHCLGGLAHCDRYLCPICAPARAASNREKLLSALDQIPQGAQLVLKVFTSRHRQGGRLAVIEGQQRQALSGLYGHRRMKAATYGNVKTLEITHGDHGFHPHRNVLEAYRPEVDLKAQAAWEAEFYTAEIERAGGTADFSKQADWFRIVKRDDIAKVVMYIAKDGTAAKDDGAETAVARVEMEEHVDVLVDSVSFELTAGYRKRGYRTVPITDAPPDAYAEAWCTKHLTWFSRSGCFLVKDAHPASTTDDQPEDAPIDRESTGATVAWISASVWRALGAVGRWEVASLVEEGFHPDAFLALFTTRRLVSGYGLGPPPNPEAHPPDRDMRF